MKRIKQEEDNRPQRKIAKILKIGGIVFVIVLVLEIWMVNSLSTYGSKIEEMKIAQAKLELENRVLENQVARDASLTSLETKANELGFSSVKDPEYYPAIHNLASAE